MENALGAAGTTVAERLRELRAARRRTIHALAGVQEHQLTAHVGPARNANVRHTLLSLAQDDDQRCSTLGLILAALEWQPTDAQRALASLALTRAQLRAAIVGLTDQEFDQPAGAHEWAARQALEHVTNNERQFLDDARYAIDRLRSPQELPVLNPAPRRGPGSLPPPTSGGLEAVLEVLEQVREQVAATAAGFTSEELAAPAVWAGTQYDVRFLLHRRASHEREHTVQVWKTLHAIGRAHSETELILAQAEIARGALEGLLSGVPDPIFRRQPGDGLSSVERLLAEAQTEEDARVAAILNAVSTNP